MRRFRGMYGGKWVASVAFVGMIAAAPLSRPDSASAYTYLESVNSGDPKIVVHPGGYAGTGGPLEIVVAVDGYSPDAEQMAIAVQNAVNRWNRLEVSTNNFIEHDTAELAPDEIDFESVVLHEMGHGLGLAHPNLDSAHGFVGILARFGASLPGQNAAYELAAGTDGRPGTSDDRRGDDININFFRKGSNNPFQLPAVIDSTTYGTSLSFLPTGHLYPAIASPDSSAAYGHMTMASMMQGTYAGATKRTLTADDVAGVRYAAAGLDEKSGTADDYQLRLRFRGIVFDQELQRETIHLLVTEDPLFDTDFAATDPSGFTISGTSHLRLTKARIGFAKTVKWHFNQTSAVPWQNPRNPMDVDQDGYVAPIDILVIFNSLNAAGSRPLSGQPSQYFYDVDGDGYIAPIDALLILNYLNALSAGSGEGEGGSAGFAASDNIGGVAQAMALDTAHNLNCPTWLKNRTNNYYLDRSWNTIKAKFILGTNETYYYVSQNGSVYRWGGSFAASSFLAELNPDYYRNPALLYDAADLERNL